jgi:hypothetical protein
VERKVRRKRNPDDADCSDQLAATFYVLGLVVTKDNLQHHILADESQEVCETLAFELGETPEKAPLHHL